MFDLTVTIKIVYTLQDVFTFLVYNFPATLRIQDICGGYL